MNEPTPLPCPFCGSEPAVVILPKDGPGTSPLYYVACESVKCPCGPRVGLEGGSSDSMLRTLLSWNTRHTPEADSAPKVEEPSDDHKEAYLKSKGWTPSKHDGYRHPYICGTFTRSNAYDAQKIWDKSSGTDVDEQLEKDIGTIKRLIDFSPEGHRDTAIARTILHLLKR